MRLLIDTNIFIYREDHHVMPSNLQLLQKTLSDMGMRVMVHPLSIQEIERDKNQQRGEVILSKIRTYSVLDNPPSQKTDQYFVSLVGQSNNVHDLVDNELLYCVYKNAVDFLLTEDGNVRRKSERLGISDRVFGIDEALEYFRKQAIVETVPEPAALKHIPVHNLNVDDPIFSSLKEEYSGFVGWWEKISREGRKAWVYFRDNTLGAILIYKVEDEPIASNPPLRRKRRLKICTFKVSHRGYKVGELFLRISTEFAIRNNIDELYLTNFAKLGDYLVELIENFGFYKAAEKDKEDVFIKRMTPDNTTIDPVAISRRYYPSLYDGRSVRKFIVPIRPEYHNRLFIDYRPRQPTLFEFGGELIIEGNTIKKAYLCHSRIKNMSEGDILLFYRSVDERKITSLGVIDQLGDDTNDPDEIIRRVGKRSVYSIQEIKAIARRPTKVILFRHHLHLGRPVTLGFLTSNNVLLGAPQSIVGIPHEKYLMIKKVGDIDERFTLD